MVEVRSLLQESGAHAETAHLLLVFEDTPPYERTAALLADTLAGHPENRRIGNSKPLFWVR